MLADWDKQYPGSVQSIFSTIQHVNSPQLGDNSLFDFETLAIDRTDDRSEYNYDEAEISSSSDRQVVQFIEAVNY